MLIIDSTVHQRLNHYYGDDSISLLKKSEDITDQWLTFLSKEQMTRCLMFTVLLFAQWLKTPLKSAVDDLFTIVFTTYTCIIWLYPLDIVIEHDHRNSQFSHSKW